jgi:predicted AlkP superfamily phosphohydrolase/phosphomutase
VTRVLVIGLDALEPTLVDAWRSELPNLSALMDRGIHGPLESIVQPVTPVAWTAMASGRNPGHFGFTDFTYRAPGTYAEFKLVHSQLVRVPTLAQLASRAGLRAMTVGLPVSYPPVRIEAGVCVSCFMAPSLGRGITQPPELQPELLASTSSPYLLDVAVTDAAEGLDRSELRTRLRELDRQRFDVASHLMRTRSWDLLFMVCMGTDRVGHYFMRYQDPEHLRHDPDPRHADAMLDQYRYCDLRIGELLQDAGGDTAVMVVSDHGMQRLDGKLCLNDWLRANGYLKLDAPAESPQPLSRAPVDWARTRAWAHGYAGQIYLNLKGRDPQGCVDPGEADGLLDEIAVGLQASGGLDGRPLDLRTIRRADVYDGPFADRCPDLFVQADGCRLLSSDLVGSDRLVRPVTELGIDDGAHAPFGFLALAGPGVEPLGRFSALHLLDVAPTVLDLLQVPAGDLEGRPLHRVDDVYSDEDEAELTTRLKSLYLE